MWCVELCGAVCMSVYTVIVFVRVWHTACLLWQASACGSGSLCVRVRVCACVYVCVQLESDEKTLRKEISYAIKNIHGIR